MILLKLKPWRVETLLNPSHKVTLLIIPIASPILLGVYEDDMLIKTMYSDKKTSESLLPMIEECLDKYNVTKIIYTRGPGSYMAIKLTYIILKSIEIICDIKCFGCSGFAVNNNQPIKAIGNLYFIKEKETIITKKHEQPKNANILKASFALPQSIHDLELDEESTPEYILPAV